MSGEPRAPLSRTHRKLAFFSLLTLFIVLIPFLYLYATGYRIQFGSTTNIISTGGMYIAAEREGTEIYIDDEVVLEPRMFRQAFYAQNLVPKTHRVTVQREGFHTWVKELPVYAHIVTEAEAFNLALEPRARVITPWLVTPENGAAGVPIATSTLLIASTTNAVYIATTTLPEVVEKNAEFSALHVLFATTTEGAVGSIPGINLPLLQPGTTTATGTEIMATTTVENRGVRLYESGGSLYAAWVGSPEQMPYYYCAEPFERYSTTTPVFAAEETTTALISLEQVEDASAVSEFTHPVQHRIAEDEVCDPVIMIDTKSESVRHFDFFLGNTNLVLVTVDSGVYVVEVDNRAWQNMQPIVEGVGLDARIENGNLYIFDGSVIYHILLDT